MNQFISYEGLPIKSGGAHSINKMSPKESYSKILEFLNHFADNGKPKSIELILYQSQNKEYSTLKFLPKLCLTFGIPKLKFDGLFINWSWKISEKNIEKVFDTIKLNNNLPEDILGPISINFLWNFHFKDPITHQILPNQKLIPELDSRIKNSRIYFIASKKSTISVWFALPFEEVNDYEINYIKKLKYSLPFNTSHKNWKIWKKSKNNNWISRKLDITF